MHQNLDVILWQFNNSKNSFIVFIPEVLMDMKNYSFLASGPTTPILFILFIIVGNLGLVMMVSMLTITLFSPGLNPAEVNSFNYAKLASKEIK